MAGPGLARGGQLPGRSGLQHHQPSEEILRSGAPRYQAIIELDNRERVPNPFHAQIPNCGSTKNISCFPDNMCFIFSDLICYPMTMRSSPILPLYLHKEHCWQDLRWRILHFQTLSLSRNQFTISFHSKVISKEGGRRANKFLTFRGSYLHKFSAPAGGREWPAPAPPLTLWSTAHTRTLELSTQFREYVHNSKILKARPSMNNFEFK